MWGSSPKSIHATYTFRMITKMQRSPWHPTVLVVILSIVPAEAVHLVHVQEGLTQHEAENLCCDMGGTLAPYVVAPDVIKDLTRRYGGARLKRDSYGSEANIAMNQSLHSGEAGQDNGFWAGYCYRCMAAHEAKPALCCIGNECAEATDVANVTASCWGCQIDEDYPPEDYVVPWEGNVSLFETSKYTALGNDWKQHLQCGDIDISSTSSTSPTNPWGARFVLLFAALVVA